MSRVAHSVLSEPTVAPEPAPKVGPWFAIVGLLLVAAILAASVVQISQRALLKQALLNQDDYLVLSLYPLESEYERLRIQLALPAGFASEATPALQLRYDIFVSRVSLMQTARAQRLLNAVPQAPAVVAGLARFIAHGDDYLGQPSKVALDGTAARRLLAELDALGGGLHQVLVDASLQVAAQITERQEALRRHNDIGLGLIGSLLALMLLFAAIALRQLHRLERHRQRQQHLASALREARIQAEHASDAKSLFLADLSHAMRTPLNGLLGMLGLLKDAPQDPRASHWLGAAEASATQLLRSLDGMLKHGPQASSHGTFSAPRAATSATSAAPGQPAIAGPLAARHVLVVEDHPINRQYMATVLERLGQRCTLADNGLQALQMVQQHSFDLVLMDVHMPVMDGVEATLAIRALSGAASRTPIAALTADVFDDTERRCHEAGVDQVLTKPISRQTLTQLLAQWPPRALGLAAVSASPAPAPLSAPAALTQPPLIDPAVMVSVRELMGAERLPLLYQGVFDQARDSTRRMREAMRQADLLALRRAAHAVKGAALNFGLPALAEAADALSRADDDGPAPQLALAVQRFDELVEATQALCAAEGLGESASMPTP